MKIDSDLFAFPFRDPRWKEKMLVGGVITLVGFVIWPLYLLLGGYAMRVMRGTIETGEPSLPEWDDWGGLLLDGVRYFVVIIVYLLPVWIVLCGIFALWIGVSLLSAPYANQSPGLVASGVALQICSMAAMGVIMIPAFFLSYLALAAVSRVAALGDLAAGFKFGEVWQLGKVGFKNYALAFLVFYGLTFVATLVGQVLVYTIVLCCLYPFMLAAWGFYAQAMMGALFGKAYRETAASLPAPAGPAEPAAE
jgi:hypothetical protein